MSTLHAPKDPLHNAWILCFPNELWCCFIHRHLSYLDIVSLQRTCRDLWCLTRSYEFDKSWADVYAETHLKDPDFWRKARLRPVATSHPLCSYLQEVARIEIFRRRLKDKCVHASDLYDIWRGVDRHAHRGLRVCDVLCAKGNGSGGRTRKWFHVTN